MSSCCFTGSRPAGFPWRDDESDKECLRVKSEIRAAIAELIADGCTRFISGMAQGADTYCAEAVLDLKKTYPQISLECAVPCPEQAKGWSSNAVKRRDKILAKADKITTVSPYYTKYCMMQRNAYMVDNADFVIAVWNGKTSGGTFNTVEKARRDGKRLRIISF